MDLIQEITKYYIEISRYRDAIGYIREGLDISQLNFSIRRTTHFLLHQINADLIASCLADAHSRIKISEHLISFDLEDLSNLSNYNDLMKLRNQIYLSNLKLMHEIKSNDQSHNETHIDIMTKRVVSVYSAFSKCKIAHDYIIDLLINSYFIVSYVQRQFRKIKELTPLAKTLKEILLKSKETLPCCYYEKWRVAELFCLGYELEPNVTSLIQAFALIKSNPYPFLYRRICFNLFKSETDTRLKIEYLLETQSVALRHKACSIQLRQKRKSVIDLNLYDRITGYLTFDSSSSISLLSKIENNLPNDYVVVALVLVDLNELYLVRIEFGFEPILYKAKYSQKIVEEFKQIISENDRSMKQQDRVKFWASRGLLNNRLANFVDELDKNVLSYGKSLLLGTYKNINLNKFLDKIKVELKLGTLDKSQLAQLRLVFNGLEYLNSKEMKDALKTLFSEARTESIVTYLNECKTKFTGLPRKHVCLLVDKVKMISFTKIPFIFKVGIGN